MKYKITIWQEERHNYTFELDAESEQDAIELAMQGTGDFVSTELDMVLDSGLVKITTK
jgi:hypothetical protein